MKTIFNYVKNSKGIGAFWIFILALIVAFSSAYSAKKLLPIGIPYFQEFADTFFPISIRNGRVVYPENTIISKIYHVDGRPLVLTLNTTKDFLDEGDHTTGLYLTRSYLYSVTDDKIQRQKLKTDVDLVRQDYTPLLNNLIKYIVRGIFIVGPFLNFLFFLLAVVFYAYVTGFACLISKVSMAFKEKMRLNTVLFIGVYFVSSLCYYVGFNLSILSFFLIMLALQLILVKRVGTPVISQAVSK